MNWDTEREALANTLLDHIHTLDGRCACGHTYSVASPQNVADHVVAAILADFLPAHDKRVRAEQRETEGLYRLQAAARLLSDLDRNEHGRHQGDIDSFDPTGISQGNPHLAVGQTIGYDIGGSPYVVPEPRERGVVKTWTAAIREASDD